MILGLGLGRHTTPAKKSLSKNFNIQAHKNPSLFRHRLEHSLGEKTGQTEKSNFGGGLFIQWS